MAGWQDAPIVAPAQGGAPAWASAPMVQAGPQETNTFTDVGKAAVTGISRGVANMVELPSTLANMGRAPEAPADTTLGQIRQWLEAPITNTVKAATGGWYEPQTEIGKGVETAGEMLPTAAFPGSAIARTARVVAPTVASEAFGYGSPANSPERNIPAAVASLGTGAVEALPNLARGAGPTAEALAAHQAGYVLPPNMASESPSTISSWLSAWGGKEKLDRLASVRNQPNTTGLAAEHIGLPRDTTDLDQAAFQGVHNTANVPYDNAAQALNGPNYSGLVVPDAAFQATDVAGRNAQTMLGAADNPRLGALGDSIANAGVASPQAVLNDVRQLRADATANGRAYSNPEQINLAGGQRGAANALDDLLERNLTAAGRPDAVNEYRAGRQLHAQAHQVEDATNPVTGHVDARAIAAAAKAGAPITGNLQTIADAASNFAPAFQNPGRFGGTVEPHSVFDVAAGANALMHGRPDIVGGIMARHIVRGILMSGPYQRAVMNPNQPQAFGTLADLLGALGMGRATTPYE